MEAAGKTREEPSKPQFPGFRVLEMRGEGAFGTVYRARDEKLDREVALKALRPGIRVDRRARERFLAEARALARVRHPNVLAVHAVLEGPAEGAVALVTEFIDGATLSEVVEEQGPLSAAEAARVGIDLCRALAAVHGAGIVHRDVKTLNVLRERGGRIVLADFGLGVFLAEGSRVEELGAIAGSPLFMAPEQIRGEAASPRTDLYALGVLLYNLATGKFPVATFQLRDLFAAIEAGRLRPLRDARPDLPEGFVQAVTRALARDPAERFQTAGAMEQALLACLGTPAPALAPAAAREPTVARPRRLPGPLAAIATAFAALAILGVAAFALRTLCSPEAPVAEASFWLDLEAGPRRLAEGDRVAPGSALYLELRPRERAHVYVLGEDQKGEVHVLFPLRGGDLANPLPAGLAHRLPGRDLSWEVSSEGGRERLLVVAAAEPQPVLEEAARRERLAGPEPGAGYPVLSGEEVAEALRGIGKVTRRRAPGGSGAEAKALIAQFIEDLKASGALGAGQRGAWAGEGVWVSALALENP
ncbi:MAG: protein kinase [Planctomycetes bacterium]|nr:protein kinase [Planctomycetota bacterium]